MTKGERLEHIRHTLQLSQKEMAIKLGLQQGSYSRMENNKSGFSESTIVILGDMGFSSDWLLFGRGSMLLASSDAPNPIKQSDPENDTEEEGFVEEMEERIRRLKVDAMDIEETFRRMLRRKKS
jgi:transcriptional regulator with XRE-family HTH domain